MKKLALKLQYYLNPKHKYIPAPTNSHEIEGIRTSILTHYSLSYKHVIETHELWIWWVVILDISQTQDGALFDLT